MKKNNQILIHAQPLLPLWRLPFNGLKIQSRGRTHGSAPTDYVLLYRKRNAPISELPKLDTTEEWKIVNLTADTYPIHLHAKSNKRLLPNLPAEASFLSDRLNSCSGRSKQLLELRGTIKLTKISNPFVTVASLLTSVLKSPMKKPGLQLMMLKTIVKLLQKKRPPVT